MSDLISRGKLFNLLAPVQTLGEAYGIIQGMETVDAVPVSWIMAQVAERKGRGTAFDLSVASTLRTMVKEWKDETD